MQLSCFFVLEGNVLDEFVFEALRTLNNVVEWPGVRIYVSLDDDRYYLCSLGPVSLGTWRFNRLLYCIVLRW